MKTLKSLSLQYLFTCLLSFMAIRVKANGSGIFDRTIRLLRAEATIYQSLAKITEETGYLFIYDSKLIDSERRIKLKGGRRTVRQAIYDIIGSDSLQLHSVDKHIIINQPGAIATTERGTSSYRDNTFFFTFEGILVDQFPREPVPYATVSAQGVSIDSISSQNENFRFNLPDSLQSRRIHFSHLGYVSQTTDASLLARRSGAFALEPKVIPLREVIVCVVSPVRLLREMLKSRKKNYSQDPICLTSFYREGIEQKNRLVSLTEGIFKTYKAPSGDPEEAGQVKLLKM